MKRSMKDSVRGHLVVAEKAVRGFEFGIRSRDLREALLRRIGSSSHDAPQTPRKPLVAKDCRG